MSAATLPADTVLAAYVAALRRVGHPTVAEPVMSRPWLVEFAAPCPGCRGPAMWQARPGLVRWDSQGPTQYRIDCGLGCQP